MLEKLRRSRDGLDSIHIRDETFIRSVENVEAGPALSVECLDVIPLQKIGRGNVTFQHRGKERMTCSGRDLIVIRKCQNRSISGFKILRQPVWQDAILKR